MAMESAFRTFDLHGNDEDSRWAACILEAEVGAPAIDIYTAASLGDVYVVREALDNDPELAVARNDLGWSPLMFAVWQGHEGLVSTLLEAARHCGHDPTEDPAVGRLPRSGRSLLMMAARFGYVRIAAMLCKPSSLEMRDFRGQTALFHAVRGGSEELIRLLMVQGADVNACDIQAQTVLMHAERFRSSSVCQMLRNAGASRDPMPAVARLPDPQARPVELTLEIILHGLSLEKYVALFELHRIDLQGFLALTEDDLRGLGVSLLGPRRKMALEIERLRSLFGMNAA